jgi:hypothetical protein
MPQFWRCATPTDSLLGVVELGESDLNSIQPKGLLRPGLRTVVDSNELGRLLQFVL